MSINFNHIIIAPTVQQNYMFVTNDVTSRQKRLATNNITLRFTYFLNNSSHTLYKFVIAAIVTDTPWPTQLYMDKKIDFLWQDACYQILVLSS